MSLNQEQIENLRRAMAALEGQRAGLGDAVVDPALVGLQQQIDALQGALQEVGIKPRLELTEERRVAEERRLLTILFTDMVGSTSLAEQMDPEEWREIVDRLHSTVGAIIEKNHGWVAQYLGDGLLAFFGAQEVNERDPEYALRAALEAQEAIPSLVASFPNLPAPIQIRIGIHTGLIVLGEIGTQAKKELTATGDATNLAARLQASAPPGGILISQDTYRCVRGVFDVSLQPMLTVKGKREPVQTYLILRAKAHAFRMTASGQGGITARTIGREAEQAELRSAYLSAYEKRQMVWCQITGEPGLGKSRLMDEMIDFLELRPEQFRLFRGRAFEGESQQPFALLRRLWFDRFGITEDAPLSEAESQWMDGFIDLTGNRSEIIEETAHVVGQLIGLPFTGSAHTGGLRENPVQLKGRAFVVSRELFSAIRRSEPVVILLEDLHWVDPSTLEYLIQVILSPARSDEKGLFILATARPEWPAPEALVQHPGYISIELEALAKGTSQELARELLRQVDAVPEELIDLIVERAEGVPYFAEEVVHWFLDHGVIDRSLEPWRFLPQKLKQFMFPTSLQHLLLTRLNAAGEDERTALQRGSIYGRNFWTGGLEALGVMDGNQILRRLQPRGFVDPKPESSFAGESEWSFHHNLLREAAYQSVLKRERARLHQAGAGWLEAQARRAGRLDEFLGLLAMHTEFAGDMGAASNWYMQAGERARAQGALREAVGFFERALALLPEKDQERRWQALDSRCILLADLAQVEGRQEALEAALALAIETGDLHRLEKAYSHLGYFLANRGEDRKALAAFESGLTAARQIEDRARLARMLALKAVSLSKLGETQAAGSAVEEALAYLEQVDDEKTLASAFTNIATFYTESGDLTRSVNFIERAIALTQRIGDRVGEAINLSNLGYTDLQLGLFEAGRDALERGVSQAEKVGARRIAGYLRLNLGLAHFRRGDFSGSKKVLEGLLPEFEALKDAFARSSSLSYLGLALEGEGDLARAAKDFGAAAEILRSIGARGFLSDVLAGLARCALTEGRLDDSRQNIAQVWDALQRYGSTGMEFPIRAYLTCADVFNAMGNEQASQDAVNQGFHVLSARAEKISEPSWRQSFLENIPEHKTIVQRWERNRKHEQTT